MDNNNGNHVEQNQASDSVYAYSYAEQRNQEREEQRRLYNAPCEEMPKKQKRERNKNGFGIKLGKCVALAVAFGLVAGIFFYGVGYVFDYADEKESVSDAGDTEMPEVKEENKVATTNNQITTVVSDVSGVVEEVMPSIVSITNITVQQLPSWFGMSSYETPNAGSGIIVAQTDTELYIVTNNHVVAEATTLTVTFVDEESVSAEIKGTDSSTDLAVIVVPIKEIPVDTLAKIKVATLGDSSNLRVGEPSIAIGNALGYGQSVTTGVISALDREVTVPDTFGNAITNDLIQTDAAINPGNSGGALLNINGEVIGINSAKYSDTDVEGMGYAIPISVAEPIINDLITKEVVDESRTAYLGIAGVDVTDEVSETYNMPRGIYVGQVISGSAAEKAGIRQGDIITGLDGRELVTMDALVERLKYYAAGDMVEITIKTPQGSEYVESTVSVTLGKKAQ